MRGLDSVPDVLDVQEVPEQVASVYNVSQAGAVLREVPEEIPDMVRNITSSSFDIFKI